VEFRYAAPNMAWCSPKPVSVALQSATCQAVLPHLPTEKGLCGILPLSGIRPTPTVRPQIPLLPTFRRILLSSIRPTIRGMT
jgi:hypothetical protein